MKRLITFCFLISVTAVSGQFSRICYSGNFENSWTSEAFNDPQYNFTYANFIEAVNCNYSTSNDTEVVFPDVEYNNFNTAVSVVDNGLEPYLLAESVSQPRTYEGNKAIKLNDGTGDSSVTSMGFAFQMTQPVISLRYLLIANNPVGVSTGNLPKFIINLRDQNQNLIGNICITIEENDPDFLSTGTTASDLLYSGWQCLTFAIDTTTVTAVNMQFIVADDAEGLGFHTAYIDSICDVACCPACPDITTDVVTVDHQEAETCINAFNEVNSGAEALYKAGQEVVLNDGFVAYSNSVGRYYIEDCEGDFAARPAAQQNVKPTLEINNESRDLKIFPNPASNELNIIAGEGKIRSLNLVSLDGKLVMSQQFVAESHKLDISRLAKGIYLLTVEMDNGEVTSHKVVKE